MAQNNDTPLAAAIHHFATMTYFENEETKQNQRRFATLAEILVRSKKINNNGSVVNLRTETFNYFDGIANASRALINEKIRQLPEYTKNGQWEASRYICETLWRIHGFKYMMNDIVASHHLRKITLLVQGRPCGEEVDISFNNSQNPYIIESGDFATGKARGKNIGLGRQGNRTAYYIIFDILNTINSQSLKLAYPIQFDKK